MSNLWKYSGVELSFPFVIKHENTLNLTIINNLDDVSVYNHFTPYMITIMFHDKIVSYDLTGIDDKIKTLYPLFNTKTNLTKFDRTTKITTHGCGTQSFLINNGKINMIHFVDIHGNHVGWVRRNTFNPNEIVYVFDKRCHDVYIDDGFSLDHYEP